MASPRWLVSKTNSGYDYKLACLRMTPGKAEELLEFRSALPKKPHEEFKGIEFFDRSVKVYRDWGNGPYLQCDPGRWWTVERSLYVDPVPDTLFHCVMEVHLDGIRWALKVPDKIEVFLFEFETAMMYWEELEAYLDGEAGWFAAIEHEPITPKRLAKLVKRNRRNRLEECLL